MTLTRIAAAAALALALASPAMAAPLDASHYQLTPAVLAKMKAMEAEGKKLNLKDDDKDDDHDDGKKDESIEGMIKKLDADPRAKALIAKHGMTTKEFAMATMAAFHAGFYVMMESAMEKKGAADLYKSYTKEQQANIQLFRATYKPSK